MKAQGEALGGLGQSFKKMEPVRVVTPDGFTLIALGVDLVTSPRPIDPQWSCLGASAMPLALQNQLSENIARGAISLCVNTLAPRQNYFTARV